MEIKEGELVRTIDGFIFKILTKTKTSYGYCGYTDNNNKYSTYTYGKGGKNDIKNKIVKHSNNIIDLIEVGDIVNGYKVTAKSDDGYVVILTDDIEQGELLEEQDIKTILTHEQYEQNCYKVKE